MRQYVTIHDIQWELIEHFKYSDKIKEAVPMLSKYVLDRGGRIEKQDGNGFIIINNERYIPLFYNKGGGLYKEVKESE